MSKPTPAFQTYLCDTYKQDHLLQASKQSDLRFAELIVPQLSIPRVPTYVVAVVSYTINYEQFHQAMLDLRD
jgi:hypothetical protein